MTARKLGLLGVFRGQLVSDAVEELDVALLRVLLQRGDKSPRHGSSSLRSDGSIGSGRES